MSHHFKREQRRAKIIALAVAALAIAVIVPLYLNAGLRLRVAEALGVVPTHPSERLFGPDEAVELIVLTEEVPVGNNLVSRRMTAVYAAERTAAGVVLHDLNAERTISLPLDGYQLVSVAADRSAVLFVEGEGADAQAVLVTVATGEVRPLPPGQTDPGIPGDWGTHAFPVAPECRAVSPNGERVACVSDSPWLLGDWELSVFPYGRASEAEEELLRARGSLPILGWAADESAVFYQNERGVWRVPLAE